MHIFLLLPEALVFPLQEPWNYRSLGFTPGNKIQQICLHCMHQFCESHRQEFFCALGQDFLSQHLQQGPQGRVGLGIHVYKYSMWLKGPLSNSSAWNESFFGREKKKRRKKWFNLLPHSPINIKQLKGWRIQHVLATTTFLFLQVLLWEKQIVCHAFLTPGLRLLKPLKTHEIVLHSFQADWKEGTEMMTNDDINQWGWWQQCSFFFHPSARHLDLKTSALNNIFLTA